MRRVALTPVTPLFHPFTPTYCHPSRPHPLTPIFLHSSHPPSLLLLLLLHAHPPHHHHAIFSFDVCDLLGISPSTTLHQSINSTRQALVGGSLSCPPSPLATQGRGLKRLPARVWGCISILLVDFIFNFISTCTIKIQNEVNYLCLQCSDPQTE